MIAIWGLPTMEKGDKKHNFHDRSLEIRRDSLPGNLNTGLDVILTTCAKLRSIILHNFQSFMFENHTRLVLYI